MFKVEISETERELLKKHLQTSPLASIRSRAQSILMREKQLSLEDIGDILSREERTISGWMREWRKYRLASIFNGNVGNENSSKLNREQREEIKAALQKPPTDYGLPQAFWDVPTLKTYIQAKFDIIYESERSYHFLLKFSKLSFKFPDTFDHRRNDEKIEKRMIEIHQEIEPILNDHSYEVFASDEVRIELEALTRRAWLKRGERTVVKVDRKREAQSYIGLLNQKTSVCHMLEMPWQNQEEVLKALGTFLGEYPEKKICIVWDNASFHKGKEIRNALGKGGILERVHLIPLPPYAPDKNPIERVWNDAKGSIANIQRDSLSDTKAAFIKHINGRKFDYKL
jgi:transposase